MNKKSILIAIVSVIVVLVFLGAYETVKPQQEQESYFTFTDSNGELVELENKPVCTAVLFSSLADVWVQSGGDIAITVGETVEREICSENSVYLVDSGAGKTVNNELLLSYEPDFVITSADIPAQCETAEMLRQAGIPVAELKIESFEDYCQVLTVLSRINGKEEEVQAELDDMKTQIEEIKEAASTRQEKKILFIRSGSSSSSAKAKRAEDHFAAKMLEELGCYNIADDAPILLDGLSTEKILEENPDHIFISIMGDEDAGVAYMNEVLSSPAWQELDAVKNENVHFLPKELFQYKPCGEWDEAYRYLNGILGE